MFVGFADQVRQRVQCEGRLRIAYKVEQVRGIVPTLIFWVGEYWELPDFEAIRQEFNRYPKSMMLYIK